LAVRSAFNNIKIKNPKHVSRILSDFEFCETFHWSINTLYAQPHKRLIEFSFIMDERNKIRKEEDEKQKREINKGVRRR
jgi:hypothetical protein